MSRATVPLNEFSLHRFLQLLDQIFVLARQLIDLQCSDRGKELKMACSYNVDTHSFQKRGLPLSKPIVLPLHRGAAAAVIDWLLPGLLPVLQRLVQTMLLGLLSHHRMGGRTEDSGHSLTMREATESVELV